ncbi:MAG: carbohydrate ABC transporter permease [Bacteroidota bacterium]
MLAPLVLCTLSLTLVPIGQTIVLSLSRRTTGELPVLDNYRAIVGADQFGEALFNTIFLTLVGLSLELLVGLVIAHIMSREFRGRRLLQAVLLVPMGVPTLVSAINMTYIFGSVGYLNELLYRLGLIRVPIDWAGGGVVTLLTIVVADMWKVTPLVILVLLAGLESIPRNLYEACAVDGASSWQRFRRITLPLLKPSITMIMVLRAIDAFRIFDLPLVLAGRNTPVLATYAFYEYNAYNNAHASAAASTILMGVIAVFVLCYLLVVERRDGGS